jgi:hypothetical protein
VISCCTGEHLPRSIVTRGLLRWYHLQAGLCSSSVLTQFYTVALGGASPGWLAGRSCRGTRSVGSDADALSNMPVKYCSGRSSGWSGGSGGRCGGCRALLGHAAVLPRSRNQVRVSSSMLDWHGATPCCQRLHTKLRQQRMSPVLGGSAAVKMLCRDP